MPRHTTHKRTHRGRSLTCSRSEVRRIKYTVPEFDAEALEREIKGEQR